MAATTDQLTALADDQNFRRRVRNLVLLEAAVVANEANTTTGHTARSTYAFKLIGSPGLCDLIADYLCARTNLTGSTVSYDFAERAVVTDASDAAIRSQISTDWNTLAGIAT